VARGRDGVARMRRMRARARYPWTAGSPGRRERRALELLPGAGVGSTPARSKSRGWGRPASRPCSRELMR